MKYETGRQVGSAVICYALHCNYFAVQLLCCSITLLFNNFAVLCHLQGQVEKEKRKENEEKEINLQHHLIKFDYLNQNQ